MRPFSPLHFLLFVAAIVLLIAFIQIGLLSFAFDKLGLSPQSAMLLLFSSLFGSVINLPLFSITADAPADDTHRPYRGLLLTPQRAFTGRTTIAVNVGGCLIPVCLSIYLIVQNHLSLITVLVAIGLVAIISHVVSRPIPRLGVGMPIFVAPISAAVVAVIVDAAHSAPLAYVCGTLGVLLGADLLRLRDIRRMGVPVASIGGAGTFDGIFITGIVAVLLA